MARDRYDDDDYDDRDDDRGRGRRQREEDDDYDDRPRRRSGEQGPLDGMYRDTNIVVLVLFGLCCGGIAFILSLIAFLTAKDPQAKSHALIVMIVGGVMAALGIVLNLAGVFAGAAGGR